MGYNTSVNGEIIITPPIPWKRVKDGPFTDTGREHRDVILRMREEEIENGDDTIIRRTADAVVPAWEDSYRAYYIVEHLQELVDLYGEGREFTGRLHCEGEENLDVWRVYVRDGRAVRVDPVVTWPDEAGPS